MVVSVVSCGERERMLVVFGRLETMKVEQGRLLASLATASKSSFASEPLSKERRSLVLASPVERWWLVPRKEEVEWFEASLAR